MKDFKPPFTQVQARVKGLLERYEKAELEIARIRQQNERLFQVLDEYEAEKKDCIDTIKRIMYTKDGPPDGKKTTQPARGERFIVEVTYKQRGDYYDPDLLPRDVLSKPGVVAEINRGAIEALQDPRCASALRKGEWMTPSVSVKRIEKEE